MVDDKSPNADARIAVFIDAENVLGWIQKSGIELLLERLTPIGPPIVRRAYGKWDHPSLAKAQPVLNRLGFELIHTYHPVSGKNSSDIQMIVDVMDYASKVTNLLWFVLATGDSDFSPLFRHLREAGKQVIGVGPKSALSESVKSSCNRYLHTEHMTEDPEEITVTRVALDDAYDLLETTLRGMGGWGNLADLKNRMLVADPAFNEEDLDFPQFMAFVTSDPGVKVVQVGLTAQAYLLDDENVASMPREIRQGDATSSLTHVPTTEDRYRTLLRRKKWRALPREHVLRTYEAVQALDPATPFPDIRDAISQRLDLDRAEAKKGFEILFKSHLFTRTDESEPDGDSQQRWHVESINREELFERVDRAMLKRLIAAARERHVEIEPDKVLPLLLSETDSSTVETWVSEAGAAVAEAGEPTRIRASLDERTRSGRQGHQPREAGTERSDAP